jgi:hypothetical protein
MTLKVKIVIKKLSWHLIVYLALVLGAPIAAGSRTEAPVPANRDRLQHSVGPSTHLKPALSRPKVAKTKRKKNKKAQCGCTRSQP